MSEVLYKPHEHELSIRPYPPGMLLRCSCGLIFVARAPGNPEYEAWWRLGWFGIGWRRLVGRIS